jgi:hypothetical protein
MIELHQHWMLPQQKGITMCNSAGITMLPGNNSKAPQLVSAYGALGQPLNTNMTIFNPKRIQHNSRCQ